MKKLILLTCAAAAVALVACDKTGFTGPEVNSGDGPVRFRVAVNTLTKADDSSPYYATGANTSELVIPTVASFHSNSGYNQPSYFLDANGEPTYGYLVGEGTLDGPTTNYDASQFQDWMSNSGYWYLQDTYQSSSNKILFPLGQDIRMDVLSFAVREDNNNSIHGFEQSGLKKFRSMEEDDLEHSSNTFYLDAYKSGWSSTDADWSPVFSDKTNYTNKARFINVDTRRYQYDIMYGSANEIAKGQTAVMKLQHAQALLYFNIKIKNASEIPSNTVKLTMMFIDPNASPDIKNGLLEGKEYPFQYISDVLNLGGTKARNIGKYLTLKTVGTFTVDNSRNTLDAYWYLDRWNGYLSAYEGNIDGQYAYLKNLKSEGDDDNKKINRFDESSSPQEISTFRYLENIDDLKNGRMTQVAEQFIPEQKTVNPWLYYQIGNSFYLTEVNLPKGNWQKGHAYIYNLILEFNGAKFKVYVDEYDYLRDSSNKPVANYTYL